MQYDHKNIDGKWQKKWEEAKIFHAETGGVKEKCYLLVEFPYPSGEGLHVGHPRSYTAMDVIARKRRMEGKNVLFPMGWDAFGLPAENYALKTGIHPSITTKKNIDNFRRQLQSLGFSFDWSREFATTDPEYYKWTQWMFLEFFKAGLAYKAEVAINWCPKDKCGLANEEVVAGKCERCGTPVEKRLKSQWMIAITKYAERLLSDLETVNYLPKIKKQQEEWIGKREGAEIDFVVDGSLEKITVFTTRPDTIFGVTYIVLAPEHQLVSSMTTNDRKAEVNAYISSTAKKTDMERGDDTQTKTGVFTGSYAVNPANGEKVPVWIADYVLNHYGTGAVMAVPAHDERDWEFATKFELPIKTVVQPLFAKSGGDDAVRSDAPFVKRQAAVCIIKHWSEDKYLCVKYKANTWQGFVTGGIEEGEVPEEAAMREIKEETGYQNMKFVRKLGDVVHAQFYHMVKKVNRWAEFQGMLFELTDDTRKEIAEDEKALAELVWIDGDKVASFVNAPDIQAIWRRVSVIDNCFTDEGILVNSGEWAGRSSKEAIDGIIEFIGARKKTTYKLRDWVFSRQRYWGEPIPLVHCENCASTGSAPSGWVALPIEQLPLVLPMVDRYEPTDTGESPLASIDSFVNTTCPTCGGAAKRETDTMPNWAGSSWYFLRYIDSKNSSEFASMEAMKYWMPVDIYNGGMEHTTLHLLYSRFWNKFLFDRGFVPTSEPYARRHSHGLIMSDDGTKMSKSKGNVVNPDDVVNEHGADTLRIYELFMGPFEQPVPWNTNGVIGVRRFLDKVMKLADKIAESEPLIVTKSLHRTIDKVSQDIENFGFNTAVAQMMMFVNTVQEEKAITRESLQVFLRVLVPFAPHVANEMWELTRGSSPESGILEFIEQHEWPVANAKYLIDDEMNIAIQVNGKLRSTITMPIGSSEQVIIETAKNDEKVKKYLTVEPKKTIYVKDKLVNFVV